MYLDVVAEYEAKCSWNFVLQLFFKLWFGCPNSFIGAFANLRKATVSFVMSVCLSDTAHGTTPLPRDGFHKI